MKKILFLIIICLIAYPLYGAELGSGDGSDYPNFIDTDNTDEIDDPDPSATRARADVPNDIADAVVKIEAELGVTPSGDQSTVAERFNNIMDELVTNSLNNDGIVTAGTGNVSKYWATDASGNPAWRSPSFTAAWDDISDPDADHTIDFTSYHTILTLDGYDYAVPSGSPALPVGGIVFEQKVDSEFNPIVEFRIGTGSYEYAWGITSPYYKAAGVGANDPRGWTVMVDDEAMYVNGVVWMMRWCQDEAEVMHMTGADVSFYIDDNDTDNSIFVFDVDQDSDFLGYVIWGDSGANGFDDAFPVDADNSEGTTKIRIIGTVDNPVASTDWMDLWRDSDAGVIESDAIELRGNVGLTDNLTLSASSITTYTIPTAQVIDAVGDSITADSTLVQLNPDGDYTLTSTPMIADGVAGQILIITCANGETNTVTLSDESGVSGSNLQLGSGTRAISGKDVLQLYFDGTDWIEMYYANN